MIEVLCDLIVDHTQLQRRCGAYQCHSSESCHELSAIHTFVLLCSGSGKGQCAHYTHSVNISIGLIGGGNITDTHARAVRAVSGASVAAIYGTNTGKVRRLADEYGGQP